eukprot:scaffold1484_cov173-Amphora_coffeaeformis.AAC.38
MTNKNKQKRSSESKAAQEEKRRALKEQAAKDAKSLEEVPEIKPQAFSKGQLNAFILIGVGIAKLFNIGKAIRMGGEPAKLCLLYFLDDDVCSDDGLNTFLRFKYMLSLQVLVTVVTIALQCWKSEDVLIRYTGSLLVPVFTTSLALVANNLVLNQRAVWYREIMMAFVVTVTTMPGKSHLPFLTGTKQQNNTVQSLVLMTFCCFTLFDAFEWGSTIFQDKAGWSGANPQKVGYCLRSERLLRNVAMPIAIKLADNKTARCEASQRSGPKANNSAEAPAGGCVNPKRTMADTAVAVDSAARHSRLISCQRGIYGSKRTTPTATAWPRMAFRGWDAGAADRPYKSVTKAPKGPSNNVVSPPWFSTRRVFNHVMADMVKKTPVKVTKVCRHENGGGG